VCTLPRSTRSPVSLPAARNREPSGYLFADCVLDTQLYALSRAGRPIPLRPKAFHALRYLLEHRDHLVTKDELCARVWPAQFISDATIESCIKRIRQAIGDTGLAQALIQTRRGYGYRFVGVVEERFDAPLAPETTARLSMPLIAPVQNDARVEPTGPGEEPETPRSGTASPAPHAPVAPVSMVRDAAHSERKLVTLLACTPSPPAALGACVELDALHSQMRTLYALAQREVDRYGGTIHSIAGVRLLAIFGARLPRKITRGERC